MLMLLAWLSLSSAIAAPAITDHVEARLLAERQQVAPGTAVDLALVLDIIPHWHTYWLNPGDSGEPPRIRWHLPDGIEAGPIRWPIPELIRVGPLANYGYSGRATHLIALKIPDHWPAGDPIPIRADITWLVCDEQCIPEQGSFDLTLATAERPGPIDAETASIFADVRSRLPALEPISARLAQSDRTLRLTVPLAMLPEHPTRARFFAGEWGLIEHPAEQSWHIDAEHLIIDLLPGEASESASPIGLLVIETAAGTRGFEVAATIGAEAPVSTDTGLGPAIGIAVRTAWRPGVEPDAMCLSGARDQGVGARTTGWYPAAATGLARARIHRGCIDLFCTGRGRTARIARRRGRDRLGLSTAITGPGRTDGLSVPGPRARVGRCPDPRHQPDGPGWNRPGD